MIKILLAESTGEDCEVDVKILHETLLQLPVKKYLDLYDLMGQEIKSREETNVSEEYNKISSLLLTMISALDNAGDYSRLYTVHDGKIYFGPIQVDGVGGMSDGHGNKVEFR